MQIPQPMIIDNTEGTLQFIAVAPVGPEEQGITESATILNIEVRAVGNPGQKTDIQITGLKSRLADGTDVTFTNITNGTVTVTEPVIKGAATAFDSTGQIIATVQLESPVPKVVNKPKRGTRTDCRSQRPIKFCRTLPKEVKFKTTFPITQMVTNTGLLTIARVRMEDALPPNVQLVSGKLVKECRNLRRNRTCSNTYRVKVISASASSAQIRGLQVLAVKNLPVGY